MQTKPKSYIQMAIDSISAFANDGAMDRAELQAILDRATADGQVDADELRVLGTILEKAEKGAVSDDTKALIDQIRIKFGIR